MRLRIGKIAGYLKYKTLHWCAQYKASECGFHDSDLDHVLADGNGQTIITLAGRVTT